MHTRVGINTENNENIFVHITTYKESTENILYVFVRACAEGVL